jgi:hypothetical protein
MSIHRECGAHIVWALRPDNPDRWLPPLEYAGEFLFRTEADTFIEAPGYQTHVCDPAQVVAWKERLQRIEDESEKLVKVARRLTIQPNRIDAVEQEHNRLLLYEESMKYECPKCLVPEGVPCINLNRGHINEGEPTRYPHKERAVHAYTEALRADRS